MQALFNAIVYKLSRDPKLDEIRSKSGKSKGAAIRTGLSRANNLVAAEPTDLYVGGFRGLQRVLQENPNLEGAPLAQVLNLALDPNNKTASQMALRRGFAGGELHHAAGAAGINKSTSLLNVRQHGAVTQAAAQQSPFTSTAQGYVLLGSPGHNAAHYDIVNRQFHKGGDAQNAIAIDPNLPQDEQVAQLVDSVNAMKTVTKLGEIVDQDFKVNLADAITRETGRRTSPIELDSPYMSEGTRADRKTDAGFINSLANEKLVRQAELATYGTNNAVTGAANALERLASVDRGDLIMSEQEYREKRNRIARERRAAQKAGVWLPDDSETVLLREGTGDALAQMGIDLDDLLSSTLVL